MPELLQLFVILPLAAFLISLALPRKRERIISRLSIGMAGVHLVAIAGFVTYWLLNDHPVLDRKHVVVFSTQQLEIFVDFYFDKITAVYAFVGALLTLLITIFSRYYLHREEGFKRFFNTLLLFYAGYTIIIFSGNFETLFVGWEFLGISSFLLIAFYRDRYLPVKNGLKVISIYRLSDICLLLAMWLSHHFWHENITFLKMNDPVLVNEHLGQYPVLGLLIAIMILLASAAKSAQLPFSSWLPRAMEGPTTSSAIFYGALSVHIGVFLLLRTYPFWEHMMAVKVAIIAIGVLTSIIASGIARVQPTVKTQIAYSSIVQIGIIFVEVALGFHNLALVHFAGNAFYRAYQLLVSPSVLNYLVHDQFFHYTPPKPVAMSSFSGKIRNSLYVLSVKEFNLDFFHYRILWLPFKWIGKNLGFLTGKFSFILLAVIFIGGLYSFWNKEMIPAALYDVLPILFSLIGLLLVLTSFSARGDARKSWFIVFLSQFFIVLSIALNAAVGTDQVLIYLGGGSLSAIAGYICLSKIKAIDSDITLNRFHGYTYERPGIAFIFFLCCLGVLGFPITPTFIGVDLLFSHIREEQGALIIFTSLSFLFIELSVLRIYARIFLGQHKKENHAMAYRSS